MKAVAVSLLSLVLLAPAGAPLAKARQSISTAPTQRMPADNAIRLAQGQLPSIDRPVQASSHDVAITTRNHGHFYFDTEVNGADVHMVFDTGASNILLRAEDAAHAGIDLSTLNYSAQTATANGRMAVAPVVIKVIKVGNITRTNVEGAVARPGVLGITLLGQSFMATLAGFSTDGDKLVLHGD
ncbi:MAG: TIGR02281 family clan AA aspartic protease [Acetobacteraceae bacterium]|jgi:aspartyl protease family protein